MKILAMTGLVLAALFGLDRFFLWCENRGWIYYRKRRASAVSARNAMLHMQSLIEPGKTYQVEEEQSEREEEDGEGAPPEPEKQEAKEYIRGINAAKRAIKAGVPRWLASHTVNEEEIDQETGLPIACITAPPELSTRNESFIRGFNEEIVLGIKRDKVTIDFRPLLMTREEVIQAFTRAPLGMLSIDTPKLTDPHGCFSIRLIEPKPKRNATKRTTTPAILIDLTSGEQGRQLLDYETPVAVAAGKEGRVVIIRTEYLYLTFDIDTTQILNRYRI